MKNTKLPSKATLEEKFKLVADTIKSYPAQLKQAWEEINRITIPDDYKEVKNIVFCGMGGSALGARMIDSLLFDRIRVPFEIFTEYKLPNYALPETLVIVSSYSGNTEETISSFHEARGRNSKIFAITTGGELAKLAVETKTPSYIFEPKHNPSKQPRMSIGYASGALLSLMNKLGAITISSDEIEYTVKIMNESISHYAESVSVHKNPSYSFAKKLKGKIPVIIASEHLVGIAHTIKNHLNESAKTFCVLFDLPEANHHLMEGIKNPHLNSQLLHFVFINSKLYTERVQKRYPLTAEVVEKNAINYSEYTSWSDSKIAQVYETLVFGSFVGYYLTKELNIDPLELPWVDYFKEKLSKG